MAHTNPDRQTEILAKYSAGITIYRIAKDAGVTRQTVIGYLERAGVRRTAGVAFPKSQKLLSSPPSPRPKATPPIPVKPPIAPLPAPEMALSEATAPTSSCLECGRVYPQVWDEKGKRWLRLSCPPCTSADATPVTRPLSLRSTPFNPDEDAS